mmetsp:Transcript_19110/g.48675  ORF Transcript_19110/g.48675 Transcript_19110/m.48675 type:complete len:370 (+) Transcript_19110:41-1150(+)
MFAPQGRLADLEAAQSLLLLPASPRSRSASERASAECERALSLDATDRRAEQDLGSKTAFELTDVCTVSTLLLVLVCSQNALYSLLRRLSLGIHLTRASDSSVLAAQEMLKLIVAGVMVRRESSFAAGAAEHGAIGFLGGHAGKMLVPASLFLAMNILGFLALRNMPAGMFAVLQQCKIVTTAVLSRLMLARRLSWSKWRALLLLLAGVVLITHEEHGVINRAKVFAALALRSAPPSSPVAAAALPLERGQGSLVLGVSAVLLETVLSGFATVYFERVLKSTPLSVWHRNIQLACWSLLIFVPMAIYESERHSPFAGWSALEALNALVGAAGGILVALCIVRFDSIVKSIAVAASIVLTAGKSKYCPSP